MIMSGMGGGGVGVGVGVGVGGAEQPSVDPLRSPIELFTPPEAAKALVYPGCHFSSHLAKLWLSMTMLEEGQLSRRRRLCV